MSFRPTYQFDHVHVYCSDLAASEDWFVSKLGAELVNRRPSAPTPSIDLRLGGTNLLLREANPGESLGEGGSSRFGTDHIGLLVDDLDATAAELKRRGVQFQMEPSEFRPGLRISFILGPDQVRIELLERKS